MKPRLTVITLATKYEVRSRNRTVSLQRASTAQEALSAHSVTWRGAVYSAVLNEDADRSPERAAQGLEVGALRRPSRALPPWRKLACKAPRRMRAERPGGLDHVIAHFRRLDSRGSARPPRNS